MTIFIRNKLALTLLTLSLALPTIIVGCGEIEGKAPTPTASGGKPAPVVVVTNPTLGAASPNNSATNVGLHVGVRVLTSAALNPTTVTTNTTNTTCSGSFQVSADNFATCVQMTASPVAEFNNRIYYVKPSAPLTASTVYKLRLTDAAKDVSGNGMAANSLTFTTQSTITTAFSNTRVDTNGMGAGTNSSITVHPTDSDTVYVTKSTFGAKHLWRSTNGGTSWANLDGSGATGIPDIPAWTVFIDPFDTNQLFLGTDLGVLHSTDGGITWESINTYGMANVQVQKLDYQPSTRTLVAFTHGRGVFKMVLP